MKSLPLSKQNYVGLTMFFALLALGALGGLNNQGWAENIYTFLSVVVMIIFTATALMKSKLKPLKQFMAAYFLHILFCVAMGWWWLCVYWVITSITAGVGMSNYIDAAKEATEGEAKS